MCAGEALEFIVSDDLGLRRDQGGEFLREQAALPGGAAQGLQSSCEVHGLADDREIQP